MYVLMEKQVVDLGIIKTYSLLQHETIKKSCIQVIGKAGLLFQCSDTRNEAGLFCCIRLFGEGRVVCFSWYYFWNFAFLSSKWNKIKRDTRVMGFPSLMMDNS